MRFIIGLLLSLSLATASAGGLEIKDLKKGEGQVAKSGDTVSVHYTGWLLNGTKFDSSVDRDKPFEFELGAGRVIKGWEQGVAGMHVGGKRELTIPPELAYGKRAVGGGLIPANSTLKFEIELLAIVAPPYANIDNEQLQKLLSEGVKIYDIRRKDEWKQTGVIKGSRLLTLFDSKGVNRDFMPTFNKEVRPDEKIIFICRTGNRSQKAADYVSTQLGYTHAYNVKRGITDWIRSGHPVEKM
ncbi:MAG: FKBP-type peptidyl-prolyl cis-trans isomerase [Chromatiales bacterium]|nr:FKBP-type peptidyl-prolyl cis-trans isomerase [Chromatiales bacterium]